MPVMAPLRSLSARMFIGAELSTHTISFKESPQHECKALQESRRMSSSNVVLYTPTRCVIRLRHQTTVPRPEPKSSSVVGANVGSLFFICEGQGKGFLQGAYKFKCKRALNVVLLCEMKNELGCFIQRPHSQLS